MIKVLITIAIFLLLWCLIAVDEMDSRTYELRNLFNEMRAKHNRLTNIVKGLHNYGRTDGK